MMLPIIIPKKYLLGTADETITYITSFFQYHHYYPGTPALFHIHPIDIIPNISTEEPSASADTSIASVTTTGVPSAMTTLAPDANLLDTHEYSSILPYPLPFHLTLEDPISAPPCAPSNDPSADLTSLPSSLTSNLPSEEPILASTSEQSTSTNDAPSSLLSKVPTYYPSVLIRHQPSSVPPPH